MTKKEQSAGKNVKHQNKKSDLLDGVASERSLVEESPQCIEQLNEITTQMIEDCPSISEGKSQGQVKFVVVTRQEGTVNIMRNEEGKIEKSIVLEPLVSEIESVAVQLLPYNRKKQ